MRANPSPIDGDASIAPSNTQVVQQGFFNTLQRFGGQVAPCKEVPQSVSDDIIRNMRGAPSRAPPPSMHKDIIVEGSSASAAASVCASASGSNSSKRPKTEAHGLPKRQATLAQATGSVGRSLALLKERQRLADVEIARTIIECNLSFNVLKNDQWKKMVRAIANVGPCDGWTGVAYNDMHTKAIDEEKERIDRALNPICTAWKKYGCSILSDG